MVHPATERVVKAALEALDTQLDLGFVFPPRDGEGRGYGQWTDRALSSHEIISMLPRAAAANARGGHVYVRLAATAKTAHPGIVMVDDLTADAVRRLAGDGYEPRLVVETSPGNFQAWIALIALGTVPYDVVHDASRHLAEHYAGDIKATSPRQPGRLPGFTNRKSQHQRADGSYVFVRLAEARRGCVASAGEALIHQLTPSTAAGAPGGAPQTPRYAAVSLPGVNQDFALKIDAIYEAQRN